ncbi:hypothetical protein DYY67_0430 [Candidatus Nitrosotalea sp. TS]|nr:hypothetical protein [Candidatus Nitrosotalea sp. TS]
MHTSNNIILYDGFELQNIFRDAYLIQNHHLTSFTLYLQQD